MVPKSLVGATNITTKDNNMPPSKKQQQEQEEKEIIELYRRQGAVSKQRQELSKKLQFTPQPKPIKDYLNIKKSIETSLKSIQDDAELRKAIKSDSLSPYYADYNYDDNTVYDSAKKFLDDLDATYQSQHEAHLAKVADTRAELFKLSDEETTIANAIKAMYAERARRDEELREKKRIKRGF